MKKLLMLFPLFFCVLFLSCEKETEGSGKGKDYYYVKYDLTANQGGGRSFYVKDVGSVSAESFPVTYGPVEKGYEAMVKWTNCKANAKISVSKNDGPFVTKKSTSNYVYSSSLSYTIK